MTLSISQCIVLAFGVVAPFFIVPTPDVYTLKIWFWQAITRLSVMFLSMIGWFFLWISLFNSAWYKGVEKAVGFSLGF